MANKDETSGRLKQAAGIATGDKKLEREGKMERAAGAAKDAVDKAAGKAKTAIRKH